MTRLAKVPFFKLSATGNDFILFDNRETIFSGDEDVYFRDICQRRKSVGADGVLLIENSPAYDFRMRYFNADGNESEMCGNGARSAAFFTSWQEITGRCATFTVGEDVFEAEVVDNSVKLRMPGPKNVRQDLSVVEESFLLEGGSANTGVPHYVLFTDSVEDLDVHSLGHKYRHHPRFDSQGTNVDFVQVVSKRKIKVRTYERGVERETLSCGTGCVAAAYLAQVQGRTQFPTVVATLGGELRVLRNGQSQHLYLEGAVKLVYEGRLIAP